MQTKTTGGACVSRNDNSESGKEFGWVCGWLKSGLPTDEAERRLIERAIARGKRNPEQYAKVTIQKALFKKLGS